jgi:hypothetical protein
MGVGGTPQAQVDEGTPARNDSRNDWRRERRSMTCGGHDGCPCIGPQLRSTGEIGRFRLISASLEEGTSRKAKRARRRYLLPGSFCVGMGRRRPTLPRSCPRSTIGAEELNDRVRDGNGCGLLAKATGPKTEVGERSSGVGNPCPTSDIRLLISVSK